MNKIYKKLKTIVAAPINPNFSNKEFDNTSLIDGLNQTVFQINEIGEWIYLNAEWEKLTGFTVSQTLGTDIMNHIHPDDEEECSVFIENIYKKSPPSSSIRTRFLTKNNHFCWVNMRANSFTNPIDKKNHLVGVISDITERVREYGLHQANYRTLHSLINNLCGLVYRGRNDHDWTVEFVSDGCFKLTGYHPSELINQTVTFGSLIKPTDQDLVWTNVQSAIRENRPYELNYRIRTSDNQEKWVWERGKGNFSSNGELLGIEGLILDITDYKRIKQKENEEVLYKTKTKLPQKHLFLDRLNLAIAKNNAICHYKYALLIISIDRFNKLQERFSADIIDKIIINVSEKFNTLIEPTSSLCLFSDCEFGLLLENIDSIHTVRPITKAIHNILLNPIKINNIGTYLTVSIGVYIGQKGHNKKRKTIINNTYTALSRAKSLGGAKYEIFDEATSLNFFALDRMEKEIYDAIEGNQLKVLYQPTTDIEKNLTANFEAQLSWQHPRMKNVSSFFFSDIENDRDVVNCLNKWLIISVVNQVKSWGTKPEFKKNVNISLNFFGSPKFTDDFLYLIEQNINTIYSKFYFSIIFSKEKIQSLLPYQIDKISNLNNKKNIRLIVQTNLYDFPSTKNLLALPINTIKIICPQFRAKKNEELMIGKAKINYIHALNKKIIIDKIDGEEKYKHIKNTNCDYIQGDFVSPKFNADDVSKIMTKE